MRRSFLASAAAAGIAPFAGFPAVVSSRSPNAKLSRILASVRDAVRSPFV